MRTTRLVLLLLGLLLIACSLTLLVVGHWPIERRSEIQPLPPEDLTLPTPESFVPELQTCRVLKTRQVCAAPEACFVGANVA